MRLKLLMIFALTMVVLIGCTQAPPSVSNGSDDSAGHTEDPGESREPRDPREYEGNPIHLSFPFKNGEYYITQGGSTPDSNYHYWNPPFVERGIHVSMRYSVDINKVGEGGLNKNVENPTSLSDYAMYGEPLYSPSDGVIYYVEDGHPDMPAGIRDTINASGNHVVIRRGGTYIQMLHLKPGTIQVSVGDAVKAGQLLGKIGNSGLTAVPHLHIQASQGHPWHGPAVPMLFDDKFLIRGDVVIKEP